MLILLNIVISNQQENPKAIVTKLFNLFCIQTRIF